MYMKRNGINNDTEKCNELTCTITCTLHNALYIFNISIHIVISFVT